MGGVATVVVVRDDTVSVVDGVDTRGVTWIVVVVLVVVLVVVGDGMTTPEDGKESTPKDLASVGPLGGL